jgi:hypothetical protein
MWNFMNYGPAMGILDFTSDFSVMVMGLISAVGLSAAMIAWSAIRYYKTQTQHPAAPKPPLAADQQDAA